MKLYVIRHGQTNSNVKNIVGGILEDINENGIEQAKNAREKVKNLDIDLVICSPAGRTKHTYALLNIEELPIIYDERLIERDVGLFEDENYSNIDTKEFWNYYSTKYTGLESMKSVYNRVSECLNELKEKYYDKSILLVTHGGVSRVIHWYCYGIPEDGSVTYGKHENCEIKEYEL